MPASQTLVGLLAATIVAGGVGAYVRRHHPPAQSPPPAPTTRVTVESSGPLHSATVIPPAIEPPADVALANDTTGLLRPVDDVERLLDEIDAEQGGEATPVDRAALAEVLNLTAAGD